MTSFIHNINLFSQLPLSFLASVVFVFALLVGSFLNVVIYRLPIMMERDFRAQARDILELTPVEEELFTLTTPRSRCRDCGRMVQAFENIPIISYVLMRGKCRGCGSQISIFYPMVELATACLVTFVFLHFGPNAQGVSAIFLVFTLIALAGVDLKCQLLPDRMTLPLLWAGLLLAIWQVYIPLETAVLGAVIAYSSLWSIAKLFEVLFKKEGMGMGDAKLLAAIFTWVDIQFFPIVLVISCAIGVIFTITQRLISGEKMRNNPLPFGPYLALAGLIALLYGSEISQTYIAFLV